MFLLFALITILGALAMFQQKNVIVAGLCMVLTFFGVAGLFLLLSNPVSAALQIIVYSGAIIVLVLFTIMLLNSHEEEPALQPRPIQRWVGASLIAVFGAFAFRIVMGSKALVDINALAEANHAVRSVAAMNLAKVGEEIFTHYLLGFEIVGLLLLVAMVGAVALTKKEL